MPFDAEQSAIRRTRNTQKKQEILNDKWDGAKKSVSLRPKAVMLTPSTDGFNIPVE